MITFRHKGDFSKTSRYLTRVKSGVSDRVLQKYGEEGVAALESATPFDTGLTARSWYYTIERTQSTISITFCNSNIQNGVNVAIILQYGHGTRNGGWVEGVDYINPAIRPILEKISQEAWEEVINA